MLIRRSEVRTRQPQAGLVQIDWSNPHTRGLVFAVNAGDSQWTDAVSGKRPTVATASQSVGNQGKDIQGVSSYLNYGRTGADDVTTDGMILYIGRADSYPVTSGNCVVLQSDDSATGNGFNFGLDNQSLVNNGFFTDANNGSFGHNSGSNVVSSLTDHGVFASIWSPAGWMMLANGKLVNSGTTTFYASAGAGRATRLGSRWYAGLQNHRDVLILVYNRAPSGRELMSIFANPWQIYKPARRLFSVAAGSSLNAAASGSDTVSGSANLAAQVALAAVGLSNASGNANLNASIPLSAVSFSVAGGAAAATATISLSASGLAQAAGQAGLSASVMLAGADAALASGNAPLAAQINALAAGAAQAGGSANLTGGAPGALSAAGGDVASGAAVLSVTVSLQATGAAQAGGSANGQASAPGALSASGGSTASGWASWSTLVTLTAAGFVQAMGDGAFVVTVPLAADGQAHAGGVATPTVSGLVRNFRLTSGLAPLTQVTQGAQHNTQISHGVSHG